MGSPRCLSTGGDRDAVTCGLVGWRARAAAVGTPQLVASRPDVRAAGSARLRPAVKAASAPPADRKPRECGRGMCVAVSGWLQSRALQWHASSLRAASMPLSLTARSRIDEPHDAPSQPQQSSQEDASQPSAHAAKLHKSFWLRSKHCPPDTGI